MVIGYNGNTPRGYSLFKTITVISVQSAFISQLFLSIIIYKLSNPVSVTTIKTQNGDVNITMGENAAQKARLL